MIPLGAIKYQISARVQIAIMWARALIEPGHTDTLIHIIEYNSILVVTQLDTLGQRGSVLRIRKSVYRGEGFAAEDLVVRPIRRDYTIRGGAFRLAIGGPGAAC